MLALIAAVYLLLALRVRIMAEVSLCRGQGCLQIHAGAAGVVLCYEAKIACTSGGIPVRIEPRYPFHQRKKNKSKKKGQSFPAIRWFLWLARAGSMELLRVNVRLGTGDAAQTAMLSGCIRAVCAALFARMGGEAEKELCVFPDFAYTGFAAHACCIFSCQGGDIILAAVKDAVNKRRKRDLSGKASH